MATFEITKKDGKIILIYNPPNDSEWVARKLNEDGQINLRRTFFFDLDDVLPPEGEIEDLDEEDADGRENDGRDEEGSAIQPGVEEDEYHQERPALRTKHNREQTIEYQDSYRFIFGEFEGAYYRIPGGRLGISRDVFIDPTFKVKPSHFLAARQVSVFRLLEKLTSEPLFIGGSEPTAIPGKVFDQLVDRFPTAGELEKYVAARVSSVLRDYIDTAKDAQQDYEKYRNRREKSVRPGWAKGFDEYELQKYRDVLKRLTFMLKNEEKFSEAQWQVEVKDILCLVYPKYLKAFREAPIFDAHQGKDRKVDFLLMDHDGHVDALEIKKPYGISVISQRTYRDNHIPMRDLSGSVLQIEKYLYHLVRSGSKGIEAIQKRFAGEIPAGMTIKVTNPSGLVLIGRDKDLTDEQRLDFEVTKRHYRNVVDIVTYDDLLRRLTAKIEALK